ncbi:MAG: hypothetical protein VX641_04700 [Planctomycetota bacterium]|nr:hypothetical protein [Planctomycetota bacterium]
MNHLESVEKQVREASVFGAIQLEKATEAQSLTCEARDAAAPARYTLSEEQATWFVGLETQDRWLSESIEADLMHSGDSLEELIQEELDDLGLTINEITTQHFRDDQFAYVFRTPLPEDVTPEQAAVWLLAYEATFRELGDMSTDES